MKSFKFILLLSCFVLAGDSSKVKKGSEQIKQSVNQTHQESVKEAAKAVEKLRKHNEKKVSGKSRGVIHGPEQKPEKRRYSGNLHRDFIIYNLKRTDDDIDDLNYDVDELYEITGQLEMRGNTYLETFEVFLIQYKEQMEKNKRYDHFFARWDALKEYGKNFLTLGGGSIGTVILGLLGWLFNKRRKRKKENGGNNGKKPVTENS